jgi:hypothetical protein
MTESTRGRTLLGAAAIGALSGLAGVAVMTAGEKAEQAVTGRRDSYVPARTLLTLLGRRPAESARPVVWNHLMHWGTGAAVGALRGMWAVTGVRGPLANTLHTAMRLGVDQTLENTTGAGAPPSSWPTRELVIDVVHKAVYSVVTGMVSDRLLRPVLESRRGVTSH